MATVLLWVLVAMAVINGAALLLVAYWFCIDDRPAPLRRPVRPRIEDEPGWIAYAARILAPARVMPAAVPLRAPGSAD